MSCLEVGGQFGGNPWNEYMQIRGLLIVGYFGPMV